MEHIDEDRFSAGLDRRSRDVTVSDLEITNLTKSFGGVTVLDDVSLTAREGEFLTLLGPSGCGKSTTLWSVAGLHRPDSGRIRVGDRVFFDGRGADLPPEDRNCGVVFQSYAVWPHMKVSENVEFPLKMHRVDRRERTRRVAEVIELVEMDAYADRFPHELSGGQQQRVALARALAFPPNILLLDEPFSNLDAKLRERAREWLRELQRRIGVTTVFVTHDQDEALAMSDRIAVLHNGRLHQVGTPEEVYHQPVDTFVADFVGTTNRLDCVIESVDDVVRLRVPGLDGPLLAASAPFADPEVTALVRPEAVSVEDHRADDRGGEPQEPNTFSVPVHRQTFLGDHYDYVVALGDSRLLVQSTRKLTADIVRIHIPIDSIRLLDRAGGATGARTEATIA
jgi:iron(III) transport system ATP-binding protein